MIEAGKALPCMRIQVHDFGGYPYPVQLSRQLARRGHRVEHVFCASLQTTPGGDLSEQPDDPESFRIAPVELDKPLAKYSFFKRWRQENEYGRRAAEAVHRFSPDVVLAANMPLDAQKRLQKTCRRRDVRFVFWVQDLLSIATDRILRNKIPLLGHAAGWYYKRMEQRLLQRSDAAVLLTEDFNPIMREWNVDEDKTHVVENWAPLNELPTRSKDNAWAQERGLHDKTCLLYAGTLGMKHNPELLLRLARRFEERSDVRVVVLSEGLGTDWLREKKAEHDLDNLVLDGFYPFAQMPEIMGAADVLLAVLGPDAGVFSVPSKVLAYLCAERPLLLAVPPENLAARIVTEHEAGRVVAPDDGDGFEREAKTLLEDEALRQRLGENARRYAENTFAISNITDEFEQILQA
ncbi:MAG: glycosyltransferase WbuB [Bacteroidetes bacterium QS_8_64_10]|nr:MAG: glycosyltransferase WbuB [Bacteroidetes bacterium QS_8_64_10]